MNTQWDVIVIGAGMSGLGAGIRLALANKKVLLLEKHNVVGGLNSFYYRDGIHYDVGLHAMTNFVPKDRKGTPLIKLCRQLRIPYEALQLQEQKRARIHFPHIQLTFTNDFQRLRNEIAQKFPQEIDAFDQLTKAILEIDDTALIGEAFISTRQEIKRFLKDPLLIELLLLPLFFYGSAHINDMDWRQFAILFKAIYREGFARPRGGVRTILRLLKQHYTQLGGVLRVKTAVHQIQNVGDHLEVILANGECLTCQQIFSSIGYRETLSLCPQRNILNYEQVPTLSFLETIHTLSGDVSAHGWQDTIVFYNDSEKIHYEPSQGLVDLRSGVLCIPENYQGEENASDQTTLRTTHLSNYQAWKSLSHGVYNSEKMRIKKASQQKAYEILGEPATSKVIAEDMFTPLTIERYTGHLQGAIYGSPHKIRNGMTPIPNLFICGTDQGFLGIVGALLSGISMANLHALQGK